MAPLLSSAQSTKMITTPSGLQYEVLKSGTGAVAVNGKTASVHYTGWLENNGAKGAQFDSSLTRGTPFQFLLGARMVIRGWDEGVNGMKVGEKRQLMIPADLGYGPKGAGNLIPPNANLIFDVELLDVK